MTRRGAAILGAVLSLVAILCVLLSLVIQLGESIRYQQQGLAVGSVPYQVAELALIVLTDREFGPWSLEAWPSLSDDLLAVWA